MELNNNKHIAFFSIHKLTKELEGYLHSFPDDIIELYLLTEGEVRITGQDMNTIITKDSIFCISWKGYAKIRVSDNTEGYLIRFNHSMIYANDKEFASLYYPVIQMLTLKREIIGVHSAVLNDSLKLCEMMKHEYEIGNKYKMEILSSFLNIFVLHLIRKVNLPNILSGNSRKYSLINKFNLLLEQHFLTNKKVSEYAAFLFVTPNYLNSTIKEATGKSASSHIRQRIMTEAIRKVKLTGASMKEVAYDLGFTDNAHFSKFFKKASGKNFSDLRKYQTVN